MGLMVEGVWTDEWYENTEDGEFVRPDTQFRGVLGSDEFPAVPGRYRLYVSLACPWAHRTLITRALLGLEDAIEVVVVDFMMLEDGWRFGYAGDDEPQYGYKFLHELYKHSHSKYTGRVTVPVLWDKEKEVIVNNESREIVRMINDSFGAQKGINLSPAELREEVDAMITANYQPVNNGVYRAGFATSQEAYDRAVTTLFERLDELDELLGKSRWLVGNQFTEADIFLFTTLVRFDPVYVGHFKCNIRRIEDYPNLSGYVRDIWQLEGVAATCDMPHIKGHYYASHTMINPTQVIPKGPALDHDAPHNRGSLGPAPKFGPAA